MAGVRRTAALAVLGVACIALARGVQAQDTTSQRIRDSLLATPRLKQVTVTATPVEPFEPVTVARVDSLTIQHTPANSPWELFRETAGLEAHEQGQGPGFASDLSIRGFSSDHSTDVALYIDGVPNNEPVNGHSEGYNDLNLIFPHIVSGIDVIRGPTSALYGNFALAGVVNVRTLDRYRGSTMDANAGAFGAADAYWITGFDHGTSGGVLAVHGFREDGWRPNAANQYGHLHAGAFTLWGSSTTVDASADAYLTSYKSPGFLDTTLFNARQYKFVSNFNDGGYKRHAQERVSLRTFLSQSMEWRTTVYAQEGFWQFWLSTPPGLGGLTEGTGAETRELDDRLGAGGTTALSYVAPGVDITFGADTRWTRASYQSYAEASSGYHVDSAALVLANPAAQATGGLFLQTGLDLSRYARLEVGSRVDQVSTSVRQLATDAQHSQGIFSPKAGLIVRPFAALGEPGVGIFANVSRGFRQADGVVTDPTLPFITVWDYEAGVKVDRRAWSVDGALFRMDVSNEQSFDPALNTAVGGGQSRRTGLDVSGRVAITPSLRARTDFTVLHGVYTHFVDPNDGVDYSGTPIFNTSRYAGSASLEWMPPSGRWFGELGLNAQGPYTPFEELGIVRPAYGLVNASLGYRGKDGAEFTVGARNLLGTNYRELESGGQVTPGEARTFNAGVRYNFR